MQKLKASQVKLRFTQKNIFLSLYPIILVCILAIYTYGCSSKKLTESLNPNPEFENNLNSDFIDFVPIDSFVYNPSKTRIIDLIHTKLEVKFNLSNSELNGKSTITLKPYFYPITKFKLDAKGFEIIKVELLNKEEKYLGDAKYQYNDTEIEIELDKTYTRSDTLKVFIEYIAKPNLRKGKGSQAIASDKGLYFINPLGEDSSKPTQIWTQGETESNSAWFPTVDSPNERMTQEIAITINNKYQTLSNGILQFSLENEDGTRTDFWKQDLPHAPYLSMMAIGDYAIIKDKWRNLDVHYYVEKPYEPFAREIFGNTPKMLEFFSTKLGVAYPWEKFHQVVVRDYVSGAMENTSAVIFGEFIQRNSREMLDENDEEIIAHELFHHWFGDLVTCESWANIPLNESFATYGEYLWLEHQYGRDSADMHLHEALNNYLAESNRKQVNMIRFNYEQPEDVFDSHSYAKGGRILHLLRKLVGDDAFFQALKLYLETNQFNSVEIHQLRLAFEKITGQDLNWFFNQWFFASGHPIISFKSEFDSIRHKIIINTSQEQDFETTPVYQLPLNVDLYFNNNKITEKIIINKINQQFEIESASKPLLINIDAEKILLGIKSEEKQSIEWAFQYQHAPLYLDRYEAIENISKFSDSAAIETISKALDDKFWNIRLNAIKHSKSVFKQNPEKFKEKLLEIIKNDKASKVRAVALKHFSIFENNPKVTDVLKEVIESDSSYLVLSEALNALSIINSKESLLIAKKMETIDNVKIKTAIAGIYSNYGGEQEHPFFVSSIKNTNGFNRHGLVSLYPQFLKKCSNETMEQATALLKNIAINENSWWMKFSCLQALTQIYTIYVNRESDYSELLKSLITGSSEQQEVIKKLEIIKNSKNNLKQLLSEFYSTEKNNTIKELLSPFK